jgi:PAS domain S-box-containing protein
MAATRRRRDPPPHFFALLGAQTGVWAWTYNASTGESDVYSDLTDILGDNPGFFEQFMEVIHPDDVEQLRETIGTAVATGAGGSFECRMRNTHGEWLNFQSSFCVETNADGHLLVHGVSRDITTEVQARTEAHQARTHADLAAALTGIGFWRIVAGEGRVEWSEGMYRIHGLDPAKDPPPTAELASLVHPDDLERWRRHTIDNARSESGQISFRIVTPAGEVRHIQTRGFAERDANGVFLGRVGTCVDVTDLKNAEAALRESEELHRFMSENAPDMITRISPEGQIKYISPSCERVFGYTPEEHIRLTPMEMCHPDDLPMVGGAIQGMVARRQTRLDEPLVYRAKHKDGHWIWVEANPHLVLNEAGEAVEFVDIVRDVSQTKAFEAELEQARVRAEAAAAAKSAFLANMSHELRTPLTSIIGFSRLLGDRPELTEEAQHYAQRISDASEALLAIINDVLDFSKLDAGQVTLEQAPLSVRRLADETMGLVSIQAAAKGLKLQARLDPAVPDHVVGDVARMRQVLLNLLSNAVKFTETGSVTVKAAWRPDESGAGGRLRLSVCDTGAGIEAEKVGRLFERFSQADVSINRTHGGTGLGLAISKGIIELMGGRIGVTTRPGKGSTFWFELPLQAAESPAEVQDTDADAGLDGLPLRILVVDDTAVNRELVKLMLQPLGVEIDEATGGAEGVKAAVSRAYDLILMDVRMPGVDGLEATRVIRATSKLNRRVPILALTADVQAENAEACRAAGMDDVLSKPIVPQQLITKVAEWGSKAPAEPAPRSKAG